MKYLPLLFILLMMSCKDNSDAPEVAASYIVNIPFDGTAIETRSNTIGIIHNATFASDHHGVAGKAMFFNATDSATVDFGALPTASFDSTNLFTISCWIKVADTTSSIAVLSKRGATGPWEYALDNQFNHNIFILDNWIADGSTSIYGTDPLNAAVAITPGQWQHIAYTADGSKMKVYLNGVLQVGVDLHNGSNAFSSTTAHLVIGNGGGYGRNYYFNGCIDDIKIYNQVLPENAIQYLATQ